MAVGIIERDDVGIVIMIEKLSVDLQNLFRRCRKDSRSALLPCPCLDATSAIHFSTASKSSSGMSMPWLFHEICFITITKVVKNRKNSNIPK